MKLQSIFETFEIFELNSWTPEQLVQQVEQALAKVTFRCQFNNVGRVIFIM